MLQKLQSHNCISAFTTVLSVLSINIAISAVAVVGANDTFAADAPLLDAPSQNKPTYNSSINLVDPTPLSVQKPAVDGLNFKAGVVSGAIGGYHNHMFVGSVALPMPLMPSLGVQLDLGIGKYRKDYISAASGLHIFYRDPDKGLLGVYGDWGYVDNEHGGRVGLEVSTYQDRWSLEAMVGVQFGQHYLTEFVDEVDLAYYFTDNLKGSIGHRLLSRGHVANIAVEYAPSNNGWSVYGEAEIGEDDYDGVWAGMRYSFGSSAGKSLIERDRQSDPIVRIPRNLANLTQCGDTQNGHESWNGFETTSRVNLCADKDTLRNYGAKISKNGDGSDTAVEDK